MDYFVIGDDGAEYGPADLTTLRQWVSEGRVHAGTRLKNFQTGATIVASTVPELFPPQAAQALPAASPPRASNPYAHPPTPYPRAGVPMGPGIGKPMGGNAGGADVAWAIGRAVLAIIIAVAYPGAGLITAAYGIFRGFRAYQSGHKYGLVALIISILALAVAGGMAFYRSQNPPAYYRTPS